MKRLTTAALTGVLLTGGLAAVAQPTQAAPARQAAAVSGTAVSQAAAGSTGKYYFLFDKNQSNPTKSKLYFMKSVPGKDKVIKSYRAPATAARTSAPRRGAGCPTARTRCSVTRSARTAARAASSATPSTSRTRSARTAGPSGPSCSSTAR
ncbi:hypothetical protein ACFQ3Z_42240 [Streptomyces nogalater]